MKITNRMTGERHPKILVSKDLQEILFADNDYLDNNSEAFANYAIIGNGHSVGVEGWRLYSPNDNCYQYVKEEIKDLIDWKFLEKMLPNFPQPCIDRQREKEEITQGLIGWMKAWNRDNAHTGQAYQVED